MRKIIAKCLFCYKVHDWEILCQPIKDSMKKSEKEYERKFGKKNIIEAVEQIIAETISKIRWTN